VAVWATGEPLAARVDWRPLTEAFLEEFPHAYFYHITEDYAELLHDMGYWINGCGTETTLQVGLVCALSVNPACGGTYPGATLLRVLSIFCQHSLRRHAECLVTHSSAECQTMLRGHIEEPPHQAAVCWNAPAGPVMDIQRQDACDPCRRACSA
jgi:hypothetical protein